MVDTRGALFGFGRVVLGAGAGLALTWPALAQNGDPPIRATVLVVEGPALEKWVVDPKDKRFADALAMLPARVRELPHDFPDVPAEAASVINLVLSTLTRPATFAVTYDSDNPEQVAFGYGLVVSVEMKDQKDAEQMHAQIGGMLAAAGPEMPMQPSETWQGMSEFATPIGPLTYGPRQAKRGWRYEVIVGHVKDPDAGLDVLPKAEAGVTPTIRGRFDFAGLTPVMSMAEAFAPPDPGARFFFDGMKEGGFYGPDAVKMTFVGGYTKDEGVLTTVVQGGKKYAEAWHTSTEPLGASDFGAVPSDAVWAGVGKGDLKWIDDLLGQFVEFNAEAAQGLEQFKQMTGVDLRADVLATLGGTMGFYMSDATGGGSLASAVGMVTFEDRAKFMAAHGKLAAFANAAAGDAPEPLGKGHIKITGWKDGDLELYSLRFPGLPIPLEPTWAATEKWLIVGATPQAAVAAARQATGKGDKGLAANAAFASMMRKDQPVISATFLDSSRMLRGGFPILSMLGSAVANGVRSPIAPDREPGLIVPTYHELAKGAKPTVQFTYWRGEDLVQECRGDRSWLVNAGAAGGVVMEIAPLIAIPAAIGAAQKGEFGMLDDGLLPRTAYAILLNPRTPPVVRQQAIMVLIGVAAHERLTEAER